ncbi:MAG: crossover junction endodeoxyribonuclease RuvC [Alphaproteobacteria bacterium]|nr:MAG: crossover junction endodeoxyribonuclease RuvC [Alphaproteobacteria bacterium]
MKRAVIRIIGLDPGLRHTGWGLVELAGNQLRPVDCGVISGGVEAPMAERLQHLHDELTQVLRDLRPDEAAVEEIFVNCNPSSALKLGMARGAIMLVPARLGITISEYAATVVKKTVTGNGQADKTQVQSMVTLLLPGLPNIDSKDASDALAVAICHAHHRRSKEWG